MSKYKVDSEIARLAQSRPAAEVSSKIFINPKYKQIKVAIPNTSVHINPRFSNAYINPLFTNAHIKPHFHNFHINPHFKPPDKSVHNVHINPKLFSSLVNTNTNQNLKRKEPQKEQTQINSSSLNKPSQYSFISNRKLVKKPADEKEQVKANISVGPVFKKSRNKLVRLPIQNAIKQMPKCKTKITTIQKITNSLLSSKTVLQNKYCLIRPANIYKIKSTDTFARRFKIDRRVIKPAYNKLLHSTSRYTIVSPQNSGKFKSINTRYKITKLNTSTKKAPLGLHIKSNRCILTIMDSKYVMKKQGRTLKKIGNENVSSAYKNNPKFNKMSYMTGKRQNLKLNNVPCLIYRKYGMCKRHELGRCFKTHDKKQIDICKEYLAGKCSAEKCTMSHDVSAAKMPVCLHYLAGACGRDNCPYPHIKHSLDVPVCKQFLRGYCVKAEKCDKRHVFICPDFDKTGSCPRLKCPYPHGIKKSKTKVKLATKCKNKQIQQEISIKETDDNVRYYNEVNKNCGTNEMCVNTLVNTNELTTDVSIDENVVTNKRPALGTLPSYIPL